jgi:hypothetical protein
MEQGRYSEANVRREKSNLSIPCSQEPNFNPYPEPNDPSPIHIIYLFKIHFIIILQYNTKQPLPFRYFK